MIKRWTNIAILSVIILCSNSFYKYAGLGPLQKGSELLGAGLIFLLLIFHIVYSESKGIKRKFTGPIILIVLALITSMISAYVTRDQRIMHTMFAQRALYYYFLYFLLHQLSFDPRDLEKTIYFFAILYIGLHFLQTAIYPTVIFNAKVFAERGTIRIYLPGAHYIALAFFWSLQKFMRTNRVKHLVFLLLIFTVYVMRGGRFPLAILVLVVVLFILFDQKVRSKLLIVFLGMVAALATFVIFQDIFMEMFAVSQKHASMGDEYIRVKAARYFMTDFFESPLAYITGNGMFYQHSNYGKLITHNKMVYGYTLGDVGIIANYALFGLFFVMGVFGILIKSFSIKFEAEYVFARYYFLAVVIGLIMSDAFADSSFIALVVCLMYLIDVSNKSYLENKKGRVETVPNPQMINDS